jgi:hypothetical protein
VEVGVGYEPLSSGERVAFVGGDAHGVLKAIIEGDRRYNIRSPALTLPRGSQNPKSIVKRLVHSSLVLTIRAGTYSDTALSRFRWSQMSLQNDQNSCQVLSCDTNPHLEQSKQR